MFDRHLNGARSLTAQINVIEKRAPTDESVRLLSEMEQAAREKITQSIRLENTAMDCVVQAQDNHMNFQRDYAVFIRLNGKRLEVRKSFDMNAAIDAVARGLLEETARKIAYELLAPAFSQLPRHFRT